MTFEDAGTSGTAPRATTYGIVARDAPTAVVLRRGPTRHVQLLRWNLRTDAVEAGQWLVGTVPAGLCGLSPNGELFVYTARKGPRRYTVASRPPYFTALAFWEERLPWSGSGFFAADDRLVLGVLGEPDEGGVPPGLSVEDVWNYVPWSGNGRSRQTFGDAFSDVPEARHGWSRGTGGAEYTKAGPGDGATRLERYGAIGRSGGFRVASSSGQRELGVLDWADWSPDGDLVYGQQGRLLRQRVPASGAGWPAPTLVADLTGNTFERVIASAQARTWPGYLTRRRRP